ncbi:hypothetical protein [Sanguibacter sp. Leaf3]|uniref:hypothetical protein n=1 Tax=Sanguibacter sp. Leaf3 TaxID=1736209 RepID=UPI000A56D0A0|nr:hypothetical protein [Sanguibacter sp. Leaf3]
MRTTTARRLSVMLASLTLTVSVLAGCGDDPTGGGTGTTDEQPRSTGDEVLAGSMTELFAQYLDSDTVSEFERDVLERAAETGTIPQADYDEAFTRYQQCVSDLGYTETWTKLPSGVNQVTPPLLDSQEAADRYAEQATGCATGTIMLIEALFNQQQVNPDLLSDSRAVAVSCLLEGGIVDASYTVDDLDRDLEIPPEASFDVSDPAANACLSSAGYSIAVQ